MTTLALDLATQTGWAYESAGMISSGTEGFQLKKKDRPGVRFLMFRTWFRDLLVSVKPTKVSYEEVMRWSSGAAAKVYCGLLAIVMTECEAKQIPYEGVHVGTIKKSATGKGNATKEQVIAAIKAKGHNPKDDNEADAIALLFFTLGDHTPRTNQ
jgi:Holliday junction resolvasome RuvABC endonuclease subunit